MMAIHVNTSITKKAASLAGKSGRKMFTYFANPFANAQADTSPEKKTIQPVSRLSQTRQNHSNTYCAAPAL